jgi:hypothetical protein
MPTQKSNAETIVPKFSAQTAPIIPHRYIKLDVMRSLRIGETWSPKAIALVSFLAMVKRLRNSLAIDASMGKSNILEYVMDSVVLQWKSDI